MNNRPLLPKLGFLILLLFSTLVVGTISAQDSSEEFYALAKAEGTKGNFAKAASYCEKGLKKSPHDMDIKEYLGRCYMELGQLERARITLLEVLKTSPRRVDARHYLINIETQEKRYYSAVCYANELLEITPYAKELWLKKVELYNLMDNRVEANRTAKRLYQIFPEDKGVKSLYANMLKEEVLKSNKGGDFQGLAEQYEKVIEFSSQDPEAYIGLINAYTKQGNYAAALAVADRGLQALPFNTQILDKKIGLLDETQEYQKAIAVTEDRLRKEESAHYRSVLNYLEEKAARYFKNADPYILYGKIYEKNPGNKEAYDFLLNTAISRGYYAEAEELLRRGLKSNPNSKELLAKQLYLYETQKNWDKIGATAEKLYALFPNDGDVKYRYNAWIFEKAKLDFKEVNYKEALWGFLKVSQSPEYGRYANQYIFAIQMQQKSFADANRTIDNLIRTYPNESQYQLNKIDLMINSGEFEQAYQLANTAANKYPKQPEFAHMQQEAALAYVSHLNKVEDYGNVKTVADTILKTNPDNYDVFNYAIGARVAMQQYDEAIAFIQSKAQTDLYKTKAVRLKLAGVYSAKGDHQEAVAVLKDLQKEYPYNDSLRTNLTDEMLMQAKVLDDSAQFDQSKAIYQEMLQIDPKNTVAAVKLSSYLIDQNQLDEAMQVVDGVLALRKNDADLWYQKGLIYEKMGDYQLAREYQAKFMGTLDKAKQHQERLEFLEGKDFKNQVNLSYLNVTADSTWVNTSIATFEYLRKAKNNTYIGRINYAARQSGVGLQAEADWYHTFKSKSSFLANIGVADRFFPKFKAAFSYFQPFAKNWQLELGGRYAAMASGVDYLTGIVGLERNFDKVWLNLKGLIFSDGTDLYNSILLQSRFYMRNEANYIVAMAGVGTAPEDQRLYFQANTFTSYTNSMVGAGYYHQINSRTSFGVQGNWYNFKMTPTSFMNQYNLFLTVKTRF